jgi:hypothetical protein
MDPSAAREAEASFFRALNAAVEPLVRSGVLGPGLSPVGLVVVETRGHRSGRLHRVPLMAARLGPLVIVGTVRGARSAWVRNLAEHAETTFWLNGVATPARATVLRPGHPALTDGTSGAVRLLAPLLVPWTLSGWAFALLEPEPAG